MLIAALVATAAGLGGALALMSGSFALGGALLLGGWPRIYRHSYPRSTSTESACSCAAPVP